MAVVCVLEESFLRFMYRSFSEEFYAAGWMPISEDPERQEQAMRKFGRWMMSEMSGGWDPLTDTYERDAIPHLQRAWQIAQRSLDAARGRLRPAAMPNALCADVSDEDAGYDFYVTYAGDAWQDMGIVAWPVSRRAFDLCGADDRMVLFGVPHMLVVGLEYAGYTTQITALCNRSQRTGDYGDAVAAALADAG